MSGHADFKVGQVLTAERTLRVGKQRIAEFAKTSGDASIVHLDDEAARRFGFPKALAHGLFGLTLAERLLAEHFSLRNLKRISTRFIAMTFTDDVLRCEATVTKIRQEPSAQWIELGLTTFNQKQEVVMTGSASIAL